MVKPATLLTYFLINIAQLLVFGIVNENKFSTDNNNSQRRDFQV